MYLVVDNGFNRANYQDLIGQIFENPPGYACVKEVSTNFQTVARDENGVIEFRTFKGDHPISTKDALKEMIAEYGDQAEGVTFEIWAPAERFERTPDGHRWRVAER